MEADIDCMHFTKLPIFTSCFNAPFLLSFVSMKMAQTFLFLVFQRSMHKDKVENLGRGLYWRFTWSRMPSNSVQTG